MTEAFYFLIWGFVALAVVIFAIASKQGPGAKNLLDRFSNRDFYGCVKVMFTQRLFGLKDLGLADHKVSGREKLFLLLFFLVVVVAFCFF